MRKIGLFSLTKKGIITDDTPKALLDQLLAEYFVTYENQTSIYKSVDSYSFALQDGSWGKDSAAALTESLNKYMSDYFKDSDISVRVSGEKRGDDKINLEISGEVISRSGIRTNLDSIYGIQASTRKVVSAYSDLEK